MISDIEQGQNALSQNRQLAEMNSFLDQLRAGIWLIGIPFWTFGIIDRGFVAITGGAPTPTELLHVLVISFLFISWLSLKPQSLSEEVESSSSDTIDTIPFSFSPSLTHLEATQSRMQELQRYHLISQAYTLPYPYLCQIYHLLNLKHLETIHSFSLNNLKVVGVNQLEQTAQGGIVKFQTVLDSPWNVLRIWRQNITEAQLTLHTPYTVELGIPVYGDKVITVIFNAIPLDHNQHKFCIDIYSNLMWYKPLLRSILHIASVLTLIEDLPYLQALTRKGIDRLMNSTSSHEMMWLFNRFVSLYGTGFGSSPFALSDAEGIA